MTFVKYFVVFGLAAFLIYNIVTLVSAIRERRRMLKDIKNNADLNSKRPDEEKHRKE